MKAEDLKTKTQDELKKVIIDTRKEQFNLRFQKSGGALQNTAQMRKARRTIARAKTFLNQKDAGVAAPAAKAKPVKEAAKKPAAEKETKAKKTKKTAA
ncbi:MAG TPA: 50S ribosomal protein L29 [Rhodospirillaceae bacterium]|nr:50S ribosomal protein L29 [Rhodospirillaceae bacterium]